MFTIGEFAKLCDISTKTLKYYDKINTYKIIKNISICMNLLLVSNNTDTFFI
ncbi:MerR family DNA-binding transcriptional regulator [Clostridium massiliamazoniense]|uniref:MerR family DNA-binding transcriptional regulator n=1 Tax=Clostridium massiliamazoniense TaxID=1347366 RepID=UPI0011C7524C|nr:MerR family DNA-binding transcriptional regulator [Clostridium massiliamazoniense]